jgi:peptidoglycan hydrolase CwlO-like protein
MAKEPPSVVEAKLPLKLVLSLSLFLVTQSVALAGVYYGLRGDIRSLQEAQSDLQSLAASSDLEAVRVRLSDLQESIESLEAEMKQPPTNLDHLRVVGEIKADVRLLEQRVKWLEKRQ